MFLRRLEPDTILKPYIEKLWVFESDSGIPPGDLRTVVPNGRAKIIVSYRGRLISSQSDTTLHTAPEGSVSVIGPMERPVSIDSDGPQGSIGVEFNPATAYRFFPLAMSDLKNRVVPVVDVLGTVGAEIEDRLADARTNTERVDIVQRVLKRILVSSANRDIVVEWAVRQTRASAGMLSVNDLCDRLGYTKRYVDMRFLDHVGISPKLLANIERFQQVFQKIALRTVPFDQVRDLSDRYYDQSHFIREFRRFSGRSPMSYLMSENSFGELFYHPYRNDFPFVQSLSDRL